MCNLMITDYLQEKLCLGQSGAHQVHRSAKSSKFPTFERSDDGSHQRKNSRISEASFGVNL